MHIINFFSLGGRKVGRKCGSLYEEFMDWKYKREREKMPTEAEAGDVFVKLVRANHEVAKNKDRNLGLHQGGEDCHGLKENLSFKRDSIQSILHRACLSQQTTIAF